MKNTTQPASTRRFQSTIVFDFELPADPAMTLEQANALHRSLMAACNREAFAFGLTGCYGTIAAKTKLKEVR